METAGGAGRPDPAEVARAAGREAGVAPEFLGGYVISQLDVIRTGRRLRAAELAEHGLSGARAAEDGIALRGLVDLYLSATWRLWRELPVTSGSGTALRAAGLAVLRATDDAVAAAAEGFERAHLTVARRQEAERLEFFDDLLSGSGGLADLVARGERLGLTLAGRHQVILVAEPGEGEPVRSAGPEVDRIVARAAAPAPSLTVTRGQRIVGITGVADGREARRVADALAGALGCGPRTAGMRRVAVGRAYTGPNGVRRSYDEATAALDVAVRLSLADPVVDAADLLVYQVLLRDRAAIGDLVNSLLTPLRQARGGAGPLLATLEAYFSSGRVAASAARQLHLSVRAVTYRLARVAQLTGKDPSDPADALALHVAVIGARLLDWPATPLEST
jgi:sugar diacid utilization regulator